MSRLEEINQLELKRLEGALFAHVYLWNAFGNSYTACRDLYTVKDGEIYIVEGRKLTQVKMTAFEISAQFRRIDRYDPAKDYKRTLSRSYTYSEIKKLFKL